MLNITTYPIPSYMEAQFIRKLANIDQPWGYGPSSDPEWQVISFDSSKNDEVSSAVEKYDAEFLLAAKRKKATELAALRWDSTQHFTYDGVVTQADPAMAVILGALELRKRREVPFGYEQIWKLNENEFRRWTETDIENFGFAVSDHIQACFDREEELSSLIWNAANLEDLETIDIAVGWPE